MCGLWDVWNLKSNGGYAMAGLGIAFVASAIAKAIRGKKKSNCIPTDPEWQVVGRVKGLYIYPLKSGSKLQISSGYCIEPGLLTEIEDVKISDKCFVLYLKSSLEIRTSQHYKNIIYINVTVAKGGKKLTIIIDTDGNPQTLDIPLPILHEDNRKCVSINEGVTFRCWDCGDESAEFISNFLTKQPNVIRLGFHDSEFRMGSIDHHTGKDIVPAAQRAKNYLDVTSSFYLLTESTLNEMNKHLNAQQQLDEQHFRPNIFVSGSPLKPFGEETWGWVKIGEAIFRNPKYCEGCETAPNPRNKVPLDRMKSFDLEAHERQPVIGTHLCLYQRGRIAAGDAVYVVF